MFFFFNDTATTEIYTLSLHDALPISAQRVEDDNLVDTVDKLGTEHTLQTFHRLRTYRLMLLIAHIFLVAFRKTDPHGTLQFRATGITGHNHYRIFEVHGATLTISQTSVIH